jgi:hypothetical protein
MKALRPRTMPLQSVDADAEDISRQPTYRCRTLARLWTLWLLVSGLWTLATLPRVNRVWVPLIGWHDLIGGPWLWISLIIPPIMFGLILIVIHRKTAAS